MIDIIDFDSEGRRVGPQRVEKFVFDDAEWQHRLSPAAYSIARNSGTELAFTGKYNKNSAKGLYRCICCNTALFHSETKFDSGTGWPSFWAPIAEQNVVVAGDDSHGMSRDEVLCVRCDAHLGHVFPDGPEPTRQRYCMNSAALNFLPTGPA